MPTKSNILLLFVTFVLRITIIQLISENPHLAELQSLADNTYLQNRYNAEEFQVMIEVHISSLCLIS